MCVYINVYIYIHAYPYRYICIYIHIDIYIRKIHSLYRKIHSMSESRHRLSLYPCTAPLSCSLQHLLKLSLFSLCPSLLQFV